LVDEKPRKKTRLMRKSVNMAVKVSMDNRNLGLKRIIVGKK